MEHNQQHLPRSRGYSVLNEPTEPTVALSGTGGHSVHGREDLWSQSQPFDGDGQIWLRIGWDERIIFNIYR